MREAMGGTLLLKIMLTFIGLYISFLAIAINYSQAFRVKNEVVNIIEQYEGYPGYNNQTKKKIDELLATVGYAPGRLQNEQGEYNIVAVPTDRGTYYIVTTYIAFEFPIIGSSFSFPITGETRVLVNK